MPFCMNDPLIAPDCLTKIKEHFRIENAQITETRDHKTLADIICIHHSFNTALSFTAVYRHRVRLVAVSTPRQEHILLLCYNL